MLKWYRQIIHKKGGAKKVSPFSIDKYKIGGIIMSNEKDFKYDPEAGEDTKKYRLPFALCKAKGIKTEDWWTPRDAWNALQSNGEVKDVDQAYADFYKKKKRDRQKEFDKEHPWRVEARKARATTKKMQLQDEEHNPDKDYQHLDGYISGVKKDAPMDFKTADSGNCNPYFRKTNEKTRHEYIGYKTNCQTCVATYVARRKGYDVRALPNLNNKSIADLSFNTSLAYVDKNGKNPVAKRVGGVSDVAFDMAPNSIYAVQFDYVNRSVGHIVVLEKDQSGKVFLYDPQTNETTEQSGFKTYGRGKTNFKAMDLTNVSMDEKYCDKIMKRR